MKLKMKNKSQRHHIDRLKPRHKYAKFKMCVSIMMVICVKQNLSNIWSSFHEKKKQHWGWVKKSVAYCVVFLALPETSDAWKLVRHEKICK